MNSSKLTILSGKDKFTLSLNFIQLMEIHVLEPKFAPLQVMENIQRGKQIERELEAGTYPNPLVQGKYNALTKIN